MAQPAKRAKIASQCGNGKERRGRPTGERAAAIEVAIRDNGLALFLEAGFDGASMEAIALRAGISKGTLYARYKDKEQLFRVILDDELKRWSKRAGEQDHLLPDELAPRLRHHARILLEVFRWPEYTRIARLIEAAAPSLPGLAEHRRATGTERYLRFLARDMAKTVDRVAVDWEFYARVFLFSLSGWLRHEDKGGISNDEEVAEFVDGLINMIEGSLDKLNATTPRKK